MRKTLSNDNLHGVDSDFGPDDHFYVMLRDQGMTEEEVDEVFDDLQQRAHAMLQRLRDEGYTEDQIDIVIDQFRQYLARPDTRKYFKARDAQRRRQEITLLKQ